MSKFVVVLMYFLVGVTFPSYQEADSRDCLFDAALSYTGECTFLMETNMAFGMILVISFGRSEVSLSQFLLFVFVFSYGIWHKSTKE